MTLTLTPKTAAELAAEELAAERERMRAYKRAFNLALSGITAAGPLATLYPGATTMLDAVDAFAADTDTAALATALSVPEATIIGAQMARRDITEYIRSHPDLAAFQPLFGMTDTQVDALFTAAMALDE